MEEFISQVTSALIPILLAGITGIISFVSVKIKALYQEKINTELKEKAVEVTVKFVQQAYYDLGGAEKLELAKEKAKEYLNEKGISINDMELAMLIEAAVKDMNVWED